MSTVQSVSVELNKTSEQERKSSAPHCLMEEQHQFNRVSQCPRYQENGLRRGNGTVLHTTAHHAHVR